MLLMCIIKREYSDSRLGGCLPYYHWTPLVATQYQHQKHLKAETIIMNLSEFTIEDNNENMTNVNITLETENTSKNLMFLIEGVLLGLVAVFGITGK